MIFHANKKKILIVDDDNSLQKLLSSYLFSEGFLVTTVQDVEAALGFIKFDKPNLIISDIMMKTLDGYDFIKLLKKDQFLMDIPLIFLTAKGMTYDRIRGYNLGCHAYITKPFDPKELLSIIHNIFNNINILQYHNFNIASHMVLETKLWQSFSHKEQNILSCLIKGYMNKEIAIKLNLGLRSVEKYVSCLLRKTNTRNRTELVQLIISSICAKETTEGE
uniref:TctD-like protein n=1 Tax=Bornetia secundiflora TaxID=2575637 RepID=A0A4D6WLZ9_9FLOR|nr:hypothetical protein [Bornetia secundiflora]